MPAFPCLRSGNNIFAINMLIFTRIKMFNKVLDRLGVKMEKQERHEMFDRIYEEGMKGKMVERGR